MFFSAKNWWNKKNEHKVSILRPFASHCKVCSWDHPLSVPMSINALSLGTISKQYKSIKPTYSIPQNNVKKNVSINTKAFNLFNPSWKERQRDALFHSVQIKLTYITHTYILVLLQYIYYIISFLFQKINCDQNNNWRIPCCTYSDPLS